MFERITAKYKEKNDWKLETVAFKTTFSEEKKIAYEFTSEEI